jgi:hypothetical protein
MRNFIFIVSETVSAVFPVDTLDRIEYTSSTSITLSFVKESSTSTVVLSTEADRAHEAVEALGIVLAREKGNLLYNDYQLLGEKKTGVQKYRADNFASSYITGISSLTTPAVTTSTTETVFTTVRNTSGAALSKGTPVHATGVTGEVADVIAARADTASAMPATYVLNEDLDNNESGQAIIVGVIEDVDTSSFSPGDVIYVASGGGFTATKPTGTNLIQNLGVVTKSNANSGSGVVLGAGRSNDVPNLAEGKIWRGDSSGVAQQVTGAAPLAVIAGRFQFDADDDNRTIIIGNSSFGTNYYLWNLEIWDTVSSGTVDTTTSNLTNTYAGLSFKLPRDGKVKMDFSHKPVNSSGYSLDYRAQIWSVSTFGSTIGSTAWTLRADHTFTSNSTTGGWLTESVTTTSALSEDDFIFVAVGLDNQTISAIAYLTFQGQLTVL